MKFVTALILLSVHLATVFAQDTLKVYEVKKTFSKGNHNGFLVNIPQAKIKEVISGWKKYINQKNKISIKEIEGEYYLAKTIIPDLSSDSIIIYTIIKPNPTYVELVSFGSGDDSIFYSFASHPSISLNISEFIRNFAANEFRKIVNDELKLEQKKLIALEEDIKKLDRDNENYEKMIKSNERANERTQEEIKSNLQLQELKSASILQQQKILVTYLTQSEQKIDEEKKIKSLQKEKRKLEKDNESMHEDIDEKESDNKDLQKKIDKNNNEIIPAKIEEIKKQKEVIIIVETKLKGIR